LTIATFVVVDSIPLFLYRDNDCGAGLLNAFMYEVDIGDFDLQVHATAKWTFEWSGTEPATWSCRFLEHDSRTIEIKEAEAFFLSLVEDREADELDIELERCFEIADV
jgi:hypothetical protein